MSQEDAPGHFVCAVRKAGRTDPPQDCDWPLCSCDEYAERVVAALDEGGYLVQPEVFPEVPRDLLLLRERAIGLRGSLQPLPTGAVDTLAADVITLCAEVEALRAQRDEAIRSAVAGWNPERR